MSRQAFLSLLSGVAVGFISAHTLFTHSYAAIFFWGGVGVGLGLFFPQERIRTAGLIYGFVMMFSFLIFGFQGDNSKLMAFVLLAIGLSLVSAFGGWLAVWVGSKLKSYSRKSNS